MEILDNIKPIYSNMENRWYNLLDQLEQYIPIYKIVDKIDIVAPSFILFLVLCLIILLTILFVVIELPEFQEVSVEVLVSSGGLPVNGASVSLFAECMLDSDALDITIITNDDGAASIIICPGEEYEISVTKEGFNPYFGTASPNKENEIFVELSPTVIESLSFYAKIISDDSSTPNATLEMYCLPDERVETISGTNGEYTFELFSDCTNIQLLADAQGYERVIYTVNNIDTRAELVLAKTKQKGSVMFEVYSGDDSVEGAEIVLIDEIGRTMTLYTDSAGAALFEELEPLRYTYSVVVSETGQAKQGIFEINPKENEEIIVYFKEISPAEIDERKRIFVKIVDENENPVEYASAKIFKDGNLYSNSKTTNYEGEIKLVAPDESSIYTLAISSMGYQKALITAQLKSVGEPAQKIILRQGGGTIIAKVIDEDGAPISGVQTQLFWNEFEERIDTSTTDINGVIRFNNLPAGNFRIEAKKLDSEGETVATISGDETKDVTIQMILGTGTIRFKPNDSEDISIDVIGYSIDKEISGQYVSIESGDSTRKFYETSELKHWTKIRTTINDGNYFPYESLEYIIYKNDHADSKDIFLTKTGELPNNNKVQMFLQQIYSTNPLQQGNANPSEKIEPGKRYYLLFHVILNPELRAKDNLIASFVAGPEDENTLLEHNPFVIQGVYSIADSFSGLFDSKNSIDSHIDFGQGISGDAKQGILKASEIIGPKEIPIILVIDVDENAEVESFAGVFFEARWGQEESLKYKKEFEIGKSFCMSAECPSFLFTNYVKWNTAGEDYEVIGEDRPILYIGDEYTLKTTVENLTDNQIGDSELTIKHSSSKDTVLFDDSNSTTHSIYLNPFSSAQPKETNVKALESAISLNVIQQVTKYTGPIDQLEEYEGNSNEFRIKVWSKNHLKVETSPEIIYAGAEYPMFVIEVIDDTLKENTHAYWKIEKEGEDGLFNGLAGETDANGLAVVQLDATNLSGGDKLIITAYRTGMLDGTSVIRVEGRVPYVEFEPAECLTINKSLLEINIGATQTFTITSTCTIDRTVFINTDQLVTQKQPTITAGGSVQITVTGTAKDGIIGAYPLTVQTVNGSNNAIIGKIDVVVSDPNSCFVLDSTIFDLSMVDSISSAVNNNCFSGRLDNFHPKMTISTNSVSLNYDKPGNPRYIDFNIVVMGSAVEAMTQGGAFSYVHKYGRRGSSAWKSSGNIYSSNGTGADAEDLSQTEFLTDYAEQFHYKGDETYPKEEPDMNLTNPTIPLGRMYTLDDIPTSSLSTKAKKEKKLDFTEVTLTTQADSGDFPTNLTVGVHGSFVAGTATLPEYYSSSGDTTLLNTYHRIGSSIMENWWGPGENALAGPGGSGHFNPPDSTLSLYETETPSSYDDTTFGGVDYATESRWYSFAPRWAGSRDGGTGAYTVTYAHRCRTTLCALNEGTYLGGGKKYSKVYVGNDDGGWSTHRINLHIQYEDMRCVDEYSERQDFWTEEVHLPTIENTVQEIGSYSANPVPEWTNIEEWPGGLEEGENIVGDNSTFTVIDIHPSGLVPIEFVSGLSGAGWNYKNTDCIVTPDNSDPNCDNLLTTMDGHAGIPYITRPAADPLVEYSSDGLIMHFIPVDKIPGWLEGTPEVRMFLKNGHVYAEYIGIPEIESPTISFDISRNNLYGEEYAILTVTDWNSDNKKATKEFQIKLAGPPSNCFDSDGTEGYTGKEFVPPLLFDWDWSNIASDQCDYTNGSYTYCDATQFTVELFRKLKQINEAYLADDMQTVGGTTSFHSYLIKDNYSQGFLEDFDKYYSSEIANASAWFNSGGGINGYDTFISDNKITYEGGGLPEGGLYQVSIKIEKIDDSLKGILNSGQPNANITVKFTLVQTAPNYNPFYETPFNGELGTNGVRQGYGASITGTELKLNETTTAKTYTGSAVSTEHITSANLQDLDNKIVLVYNKMTNRLAFNPAQPTPVVMVIEGDEVVYIPVDESNNLVLGNGRVEGAYKVVGTGAGTAPAKKWTLIGSTIGAETCLDFEGFQKNVFFDTATGNKRSISWGGIEGGTIELATVFFTPKGTDLKLEPANVSTTLVSKENLVNAETVMLTNYDSAGNNNYDTLETVFDMIAENKLCISKDSAETLKVWWNPEALEEELINVDTTTPGC